MSRIINEKILEKAGKSVLAGLSLTAAAKKHKISRTTLSAFLQSEGKQSSHQKRLTEIAQYKDRAIQMRKNGMSISKIAKTFSLSQSTVSIWCQNIPISDKQYLKNLCREPEKKELAIKYRKQGMFTTEIAKTLNCSKASVSLWLKQARLDDESLDNLVSHRKSEGSYKADCVHYIDKVVELRMSGYTYAEIAKLINKKFEFVTYTFSQFNCSDEQTSKITKLVKERTRHRRRAGELKPVGGIRQGVERSKFGYYKGIYCSSTYELCWVIYNLDHGNEVKRFDGFLECPKEKFKYYPDFIQNENEIIEIKGYENESVARKTALAESLGYKVSLLKKDDLKHIFEYVDKTYNVKPLSRHILYDNYKPVYLFCCSQCQNEFEVFKLRDRHKTGQTIFCSSKCATAHRVSQPDRVSLRKISLEDTCKVKADRAAGMTLRSIAAKYSVSLCTIQTVLKRP